jgi:SH3-like domain-containing protein
MMRASVEDCMIHRFLCLLSLCAACLVSMPQAFAADSSVGSVTGQPIPRFVSLKSSQTNLREGPSRDHRIAWVFKRSGLPVEVIAEFETWRRIRDSEGSEGWVMLNFISCAAPRWWPPGQRKPPFRSMNATARAPKLSRACNPPC